MQQCTRWTLEDGNDFDSRDCDDNAIHPIASFISLWCVQRKGCWYVADLFSVSLMFCDPHKKVKGIVLSLKRCRVYITPNTPFHWMTGGALGVPSCVISISRWPDVHFTNIQLHLLPTYLVSSKKSSGCLVKLKQQWHLTSFIRGTLLADKSSRRRSFRNIGNICTKDKSVTFNFQLGKHGNFSQLALKFASLKCQCKENRKM